MDLHVGQLDTWAGGWVVDVHVVHVGHLGGRMG